MSSLRAALEKHASITLSDYSRAWFARAAILACRRHPAIGLLAYRSSADSERSELREARNLMNIVCGTDVVHPLVFKSSSDAIKAVDEYEKFCHVLRCLGYHGDAVKFERAVRSACRRFSMYEMEA